MTLPVSVTVREMSPEYPSRGIEHGSKCSNNRQEVIVVDERLTVRLVHGVDVADGLRV